MTGFSFITKEYRFLKPSCITCLSNCHGLPNRICPACMGTTSHKTSSWYLPIENDTSTC
uniref:Uncharacterized protein n=1 Tax=Rhizophora mucronata TaxID=61149 RepID=A0A2P2QWG8_RHIMU